MDPILQPCEPSSDQIKEMYARFGAAYYFADCLNREVCHFYVAKNLDHKIGITRPRVEELLSVAYAKTLGILLSDIADHLSDDERGVLQDALENRNFLAHHFWYERCHLMQSKEGVDKLIAELSSYRYQFEFADRMLTQRTAAIYKDIGVTDAIVANAMTQLRAGIPPEPLPECRKLKKQERFVKVWEHDTANGRSLVFQTDDGCFWQLCDVGLGWSLQSEVKADWIEHSDVAPYLPASFNPRPIINGPWDYEFQLAKGAVLWVRPSSDSKAFRWGLRRPKSGE